MCGICGFQLKPGAEDQVNARLLMADLLQEIEWRGRDATGVAWWGPNEGRLCLDKQPVSATKYASRVPLSSRTRTAIGHTRLATQGDPEFNHNNHPVRVGDPGSRTVGVHNGVVYNDESLWSQVDGIERKGLVDTEALYAYLHYKYQGEVPLDLTEVMGSYALAWLNERDPGVLRLMRGTDSPLHIAYSDLGVLFASTKADVKAMADVFGPYYTVVYDADGNEVTSPDGVFEFGEGEWGVFEDGECLDSGTCEVQEWGTWRGSLRSTSRQSCDGAWPDEGDAWSWTGRAGERSYATVPASESASAFTSGGRSLAMVDRWSMANTRNEWENVPEYGWNFGVKDNAIWVESVENVQGEGWVHIYDDGSFIQNNSPAPPFWHNIDPQGPEGPDIYGFTILGKEKADA